MSKSKLKVRLEAGIDKIDAEVTARNASGWASDRISELQTLRDNLSNRTTIDPDALSMRDLINIKISQLQSTPDVVRDIEISQLLKRKDELNRLLSNLIPPEGTGLITGGGAIIGEGLTPSSVEQSEFVTAEDGNFWLDGEQFRFVGANAYYLQTGQGYRGSIPSSDNPYDVKDVPWYTLRGYADTGVKVVRTWGFYSGPPSTSGEESMSLTPGVLNEPGFELFDRIFAEGKRRGLKFYISFEDKLANVGEGVQFYMDAFNVGSTLEFIELETQASIDANNAFKDYISGFLNRVNPHTGIAYKDDPAVFAWNIMNELRPTGGGQLGDGTACAAWYQDIAQHIKSIDTNHMVGCGEEGWEIDQYHDIDQSQFSNSYWTWADYGTSFSLNTAVPEIDFGQAHIYPGFHSHSGGWNITFSGPEPTQEEFDGLVSETAARINAYNDICNDLNKPFILGEWGLHWAGDGGDNQNRIEWLTPFYQSVYDEVEQGLNRLGGHLHWAFLHGFERYWEFPGSIRDDNASLPYTTYPNDTPLPQDFKAHVNNMNT